MLTEVRVGLNLVELRRVRRRLSGASAGEINRLLSELGRYFHSDAAHAPAELLAPIDASLDAVAANEEEPARRRALLGLIDLRRSLFPNAPPYRASGPSVREPGIAA